jgi:hypothetical protein
LPGKTACWAHDESLAGKRTAARSAGGKTRSQRTTFLPSDTQDATLATIADTVTILGQTINQVRRGEMDVSVAKCVIYGVSVLVKALQGSELEARFQALQAVLLARKDAKS